MIKKQGLACQYSAIINSELYHLRMGEYKKTDDDKQICIMKFVLFSILSTNLLQIYVGAHQTIIFLEIQTFD